MGLSKQNETQALEDLIADVILVPEAPGVGCHELLCFQRSNG